jgi:lipopolysaccharide transport protein LptA
VNRVVCTSNVVVVDGDRWARGERADFDVVHGLLEVTGSPEAMQGESRIAGTKVTLYTGQDFLTVENAKGALAASSKGQLPVDVSADRSELHSRRRQIVLLGNVKAVRGPTTLRCSRAIAHYTAAQELQRVDCSGKVEATDGDKWARGERGEFNVRAGVLDVTGNPQARKGTSKMEGTRVTFHVGQDQLEVENGRLEMQK